MRKEIRCFHLDVMSIHESIMFETLIYPHNIVSEGVKSMIFEEEEGETITPMRGYLAVKEEGNRKVKYFLDEKFYKLLPIRANECDELYMKDSSRSRSIVMHPLEPTEFRIFPEQKWDTAHEFIDMLVPFEHTCSEQWTLHKMMAVMGYVGKLFIGDCSKSEFGKSSIFEVLHSITKKSPVFQPRSVPGVLAQITGEGNMVFDEVGNTNSDTKRCMENFTLQVGGNKPVYINGAQKSKYTKSKYNVGEQSITFLYNTLDQYKSEDEFFEKMFANNKAIDSRLLKLRFDGVLKERFDKNFDMIDEAEKNKQFYIDIAKHLLYLKDLNKKNKYQRRFDYPSILKLSERKRRIYEELTWLIDMYSKDNDEYAKYIQVLNGCINSYKEMIGQPTYQIIEEVIEDENSEKDSKSGEEIGKT